MKRLIRLTSTALGKPARVRVYVYDDPDHSRLTFRISRARTETGHRWSLSCGDWITDTQAAPILAARGDDT